MALAPCQCIIHTRPGVKSGRLKQTDAVTVVLPGPVSNLERNQRRQFILGSVAAAFTQQIRTRNDGDHQTFTPAPYIPHSMGVPGVKPWRLILPGLRLGPPAFSGLIASEILNLHSQEAGSYRAGPKPVHQPTAMLKSRCGQPVSGKIRSRALKRTYRGCPTKRSTTAGENASRT